MVDTLSRKNILLKILMEHYHQGSVKQVLSKGLPAEKVRDIAEISVSGKHSAIVLDSPEKELSQLHYSWIAEAIDQFPMYLHPILLNVLPKLQAEGLAKMKRRSLEKKTLSPVAKKFFLYLLRKKIQGIQSLFTVDYLYPTPLAKLLEIDTYLLFEMFDLLGLYDLSIKLKYIIDKKIISNVYKSLSPAKKKFLLALIHQKGKIQLSDMDLLSWSGDPLVLKNMVHRRGLLRFGKALSGYPQDFIWCLIHKLDTGRGRIVMQHYKEQEYPETAVLREQVLFIMNLLTQKNEA